MGVSYTALIKPLANRTIENVEQKKTKNPCREKSSSINCSRYGDLVVVAASSLGGGDFRDKPTKFLDMSPFELLCQTWIDNVLED